MRHLNVANLLHALLTLLLLFEQFTLTAHVTTIALCRYVLAHLLHRFSGNNFGAYSSLDSNVELLTRNQLLQFLAHAAPKGLSIVKMGQCRECIHRVSIEQDVKLNQLRGPEAVGVVVE